MKKIVISINNLGVGGAERLVVNDINEMLKQGYDVHLLTLKKEPLHSLSGDLMLSKEKWTVIEAKSIWHFVAWWKIFVFIMKNKPDVVFSHLWFSNTILGIVCFFARVKIIIFEQNVYDMIKNKRMYWVDRVVQHVVYKVVAVSMAVQESLIRHGIKEKNIIVIQNSIELSNYAQSNDPYIRKELAIPEDTFVFVTVGRLIEQKGIDILIHAMKLLPENAVALIAGLGKLETKLKSLAEQSGCGHRIYFLGSRKDIPQLLLESDVFVLASRWEGLPMVVLEAMAARLPIVVSDFEGGKDIIRHANEGLVVPKENPEALAQAMQSLMENAHLREKISRQAYERVKEFSIQNHVRKIMAL